MIEAKPLIVEYELTPYSYSLKEVVESLIKWGKSHRVKLKEESLENTGSATVLADSAIG